MTILKIQKTANIGQIILNSPQSLNLIEEDTFEAINSALKEFESDNEIKVTLISAKCGVSKKTGKKIFSAGVNLKNYEKKFELLQKNPELFRTILESKRAILEQINKSKLPVVIAIDGLVTGGFFELALFCDVIIASEQAEFSLNEVNIGLIPGYGGINKLLSIAGKNRAYEIITTGRRITATEALKLGIISVIFSDKEFEEKATQYTLELANKPANSLLLIKDSIRGILNGENADEIEVKNFMEAAASAQAKQKIKDFLFNKTT